MQRLLRPQAGLYLLLLLFSSPALADKRVALVIGNANYQHVSHLPNPVNDTADIGAALERLGFAIRRENDLDRTALRRAVSEFSDSAVGADIALVYFAGHGLEVDGENYLIPVDAVLETDRRIRFEAVPLDDALEGAKGLRIVLLDACRSNPFLASMKVTSPNSVHRHEEKLLYDKVIPEIDNVYHKAEGENSGSFSSNFGIYSVTGQACDGNSIVSSKWLIWFKASRMFLVILNAPFRIYTRTT